MPETRPQTVSLAALRARIGALEAVPPGRGADAVAFGVAEVDGVLPWGGLPRSSLHEIVSDGGTTAAEGFCAALLARFAAGRGPALWCLARGDLHGPGLGVFGLDPDRLILARARRPADVLWAMEEGLRSGRLGAVLGEVRDLGPGAGRRLQLAARTGGTACLALRPPAASLAPGAALTRWRVAAAPGRMEDGPIEGGVAGAGATQWRVELLRCRGAAPHVWLLEWNNEARHFAVAPALAERASRPAAHPPAAALSRRRAAG